jgi:hypothetical protein
MDRSRSNQVLGAFARSEVTVHRLPPLPWRKSFSTACPLRHGDQLACFRVSHAPSRKFPFSFPPSRGPLAPTFSASSGQSGSRQSLEAARARGPYSTPLQQPVCRSATGLSVRTDRSVSAMVCKQQHLNADSGHANSTFIRDTEP